MDTADNTTGDICNLHLSKAHRAIFGSILIAVTVVGTVGNFILSFFVMRKTEMRSLINILLANMAISDALISIFCAPFDLITIIYGTWIFGKSMCCTHSFFLSVLVVQNVMILIIISVDRYFILVHKKDKFRRCQATTLMFACVVFSVAVSSPPLFDVGKVVFANEHCRHMYKVTRGDRVYSILYSSFLFVLPCGLLLLAYVHIVVTIRKTTRRIHPVFHRTLRRTNFEGHSQINVKFKRKTFSTILYLYGAAMVCKLPLALSIFVHSLTLYGMCPMSHWIMLLTYLNSAINPFIYAFKINEYWMMVTGKFDNIKNRVKSYRRSGHLSQPQNIYMIASDTSSVL